MRISMLERLISNLCYITEQTFSNSSWNVDSFPFLYNETGLLFMTNLYICYVDPKVQYFEDRLTNNVGDSIELNLNVSRVKTWIMFPSFLFVALLKLNKYIYCDSLTY